MCDIFIINEFLRAPDKDGMVTSIRMSRQAREKLEEIARQRCMTLGELIRYAILYYYVNEICGKKDEA